MYMYFYDVVPFLEITEEDYLVEMHMVCMIFYSKSCSAVESAA